MSTVGVPLQTYGSGKYGAAPVEMLGLDYYLGLLTSEYRNSQKLNAFLRVLLQKFDDISQCLVAMDDAFDVDNAVGPQLDLIGAIVGATRAVPFQPSNSVSPVLDDGIYKIYLKAKIAQNQWDGTIDSLQTVWQDLFPFGRIAIQDEQNMTATIFLTGAFTSIEQDLIINGFIVPRPQGVLYNYVFSKLPAFGFDLNNSLIAGFDTGYWA
jgi:hypothetical protein